MIPFEEYSREEQFFIKCSFCWLIIAAAISLGMILIPGTPELGKNVPFLTNLVIIGWLLSLAIGYKRIEEDKSTLFYERKKLLRFLYELFFIIKAEEKYEEKKRREFFYKLFSFWIFVSVIALIIIVFAMSRIIGNYVAVTVFPIGFIVSSIVIGYIGSLAASPFYSCSQGLKTIAACAAIILAVKIVMHCLLAL